MKLVAPQLDTLPESQRSLWPELKEIGSDFILYGGTALSLQLGGRTSIDFDFFSEQAVEAESLRARYSFLKNATLVQRAAATATFLVNWPETVQISFFGTLHFGRVDEPVRFTDNGLLAAGLLDLAAQKIKVIQFRAEAKDYIDICTLLRHGVSLESSLGAAKALYPEYNPSISLQALTYFKDGDLPSLSDELRQTLIVAAARVRQIPIIPKASVHLAPTE
jgi:hypothetical protein